jgi:hypothetical protein
MEIGRPAGLAPGTDLDVPIVFRIERLAIEAGRFRWELLVNDERIQHATFEVIRPD